VQVRRRLASSWRKSIGAYAEESGRGISTGAWDDMGDEKASMNLYRVIDAAPALDEDSFATPDLLAVVPRQNLNENRLLPAMRAQRRIRPHNIPFPHARSMTTWKLLCFVTIRNCVTVSSRPPP
jgi:hypothetical protein